MTTLNLRALYACNMVASKEDTRYYLNGVYTHVIETGAPECPKQRIYVATDGHRLLKLVTLPNQDDNGEALIIPSHAIVKVKDCNEGILTVSTIKNEYDIESQRAELTYGDNTIVFVPVYGVYPDYVRAIPSKDPEATTEIGVNATALQSIEKAVRYYRGYSSKQALAMPLEFRGASEPIKINFNHGETGVLMPMRA